MNDEAPEEPMEASEVPTPEEVDPELVLAAQQESALADKALLAHLSSRVPQLRRQLNKALARVQELESERSIKQPQDHKPAARSRKKA